MVYLAKYRRGEVSYPSKYNLIRNGTVSDEEAFFLLYYTGSASSWVNEDLRQTGVQSTKCKELFSKHLEVVMSKLPSFNGIAYRMDDPSGDKQDVLRWFKRNMGKKIQIPHFLSTAKEDYDNSPIVWQIQTLKAGSRGKDITECANNDVELEVLFSRNSKFLIENIDVDKGYVYLTEISDTVECDIILKGLYHNK
jgi:hypothetical protein